MKEYLVKNIHGEYKSTDHHSGFSVEDLIEIPAGADFYVKSKIIEDNFFFCMDNSGVIETYDTMQKNQWHREILKTRNLSKNYEILWQRPTHPEPLPFIDDEPQSINDQYAEIEQVRMNQKTIDAMREAEGILSDKQLKGVEATLSERQSTYGSFVGVANTTGQLMGVVKNSANGQTLPYAHEEALHMICSKIARIVNGDCNHKDSWHDIGGYAKLIENLIEGE